MALKINQLELQKWSNQLDKFPFFIDVNSESY